MTSFKRPESLPFPKIWRRFKGLKTIPDGRIPEFWIQDATEDMAEEIGDHMLEHFVRDEMISQTLPGQDEEPNMLFRGMLVDLVKERLTLAAFTDGADGQPLFVGCNVLYVAQKGVPMPMPVADADVSMRAVTEANARCDVFAKYGVDAFTSALGLSVLPAYRGQGVGVELLKARAQLTHALGLRLTVNTFSGAASQKQAERAGYELLVRLNYADCRDDTGAEIYPGIRWPYIELRARYMDADATDDDFK